MMAPPILPINTLARLEIVYMNHYFTQKYNLFNTKTSELSKDSD